MKSTVQVQGLSKRERLFFNGLIYLALIVLTTFLLVGCKGENKSVNQLKRIDVVASPIATLGVSELTLTEGNTQAFIATGHYADGSTRDITKQVSWSLSNKNVANISADGLLTAVSAGDSSVTASQDGIVSNSVNINVNAAVITAIQITPDNVSVAKGQTRQLTALAVYNNNTTYPITDSVTWTSNDASIINITADGLLTGADIGNTSVTASKDGVTSNTVNIDVNDAVITAFQITPDNKRISVPKGQTQQLAVLAIYSDGTPDDITSSVTWLSNDSNIVTVTAEGLLTGVEIGNASVMASKDGVVIHTIDIEINDAVVTAFQITPEVVSVAKGQTQQLAALAIYSNGTTYPIKNDSVLWESDDINTATVTPDGLLTGVEIGNANVTVKRDGIAIIFNVEVSNAVVTSIQITPDIVSVGKGQTQQLTALATYSDSTTLPITNSVAWLPDDINTVTVTADGLLTGAEIGNTSVTASKDGFISNTINVDITPWLNVTGTGDVYVEPAVTKMSWDAAVLYCQNLTIGNGGWKLPSNDELLAIQTASFASSLLTPAATGSSFWSSTPEVGKSGSHYAVEMKLKRGQSYPSSDRVTYYHTVMCVR